MSSTIPDYFRNSLDVVTGYAQAFSFEYETGFRWQIPAALLAIAALTHDAPTWEDPTIPAAIGSRSPSSP